MGKDQLIHFCRFYLLLFLRDPPTPSLKKIEPANKNNRKKYYTYSQII